MQEESQHGAQDSDNDCYDKARYQKSVGGPLSTFPCDVPTRSITDFEFVMHLSLVLTVHDVLRVECKFINLYARCLFGCPLSFCPTGCHNNRDLYFTRGKKGALRERLIVHDVCIAGGIGKDRDRAKKIRSRG